MWRRVVWLESFSIPVTTISKQKNATVILATNRSISDSEILLSFISSVLSVVKPCSRERKGTGTGPCNYSHNVALSNFCLHTGDPDWEFHGFSPVFQGKSQDITPIRRWQLPSIFFRIYRSCHSSIKHIGADRRNAVLQITPQSIFSNSGLNAPVRNLPVIPINTV